MEEGRIEFVFKEACPDEAGDSCLVGICREPDEGDGHPAKRGPLEQASLSLKTHLKNSSQSRIAPPLFVVNRKRHYIRCGFGRLFLFGYCEKDFCFWVFPNHPFPDCLFVFVETKGLVREKINSKSLSLVFRINVLRSNGWSGAPKEPRTFNPKFPLKKGAKTAVRIYSERS